MTSTLNILFNAGLNAVTSVGQGLINALHYIFPNFG